MTGLALGSGGARGWAHIGVIMALKDLKVPVDLVAGTSMGSLVGAALASDRITSLHKIAVELDWTHLFHYFLEFNFPRSGLVDGGKIVEFISDHVSTGSIEDLLMPYAAVAVDVITGNKVIINKGDVIQAVRASISVPGIFAPVKYGDAMLVDGGLADPVPVDVVRDMGADTIIAVNLNRNIGDIKESPLLPGPRIKPIDKIERKLTDFIGMINRLPIVKKKPFDLGPLKDWFESARTPDILEIMGNSIRIMEAQLAQFQLAASKPDILIEPPLHQINFMDFHRADEAIQIGYHETMKVMKSRITSPDTTEPDPGPVRRAFDAIFRRSK